ncbi:serine/threonine-protein kinase [Streptomyces sp. NPDC059814]|uniref:serine/threonine-protein kinase n=1 Tax=unclassified Streptomyces TaxID=2593676 RepID=UPI003661147A
MTDDGGQKDEPTSYALRPPHVPAPSPGPPTERDAPARVPEQGAGRLLGGRYRLVGRLGDGGMGTVWRAHDEVVERDVAVKEPRLPEHLGAREREVAHLRMQREARAAARIDHPSVVTVHDVVVEDAKPWIVMELVRGQSLAELLQEGTLDPREASRIGLAVLGALIAAHGAGVLHRDVKPANVLLGRGDRVVLTDFGIAQVEGEEALTETGAFVGSPEYIAPERVLGQRPGPESDLWSLGVVLYASVEGVSPYRRSHTPATLQAVLSAEPQMPARGAGAFGMLVMQLLRKDPGARPAAAEVRQTLESVASAPSAPAAATRLPGGGRGGAGDRWLPPVLHGNRRAQYGFGGGLLALVLALVLIFVNPFTGGELPDGWQVRPEREVLQADVTVPQEYKRRQADGGAVWFTDPGGVTSIDFWHRAATPGDANDPGPDAAVRQEFYEKGGSDSTQMKEVSVTHRKITHQGREGFEMTVEYAEYSNDSLDLPRRRYQELWIPGERKGGPYWLIRVETPAEGQTARDGEKIFDQVVEGLKIQFS